MKRERGVKGGGRLEDKRARLEAGEDLEVGKDLVDLQLQHIVKEVSPPTSVQDALSVWVKNICTSITGSKLPKCSSLAKLRSRSEVSTPTPLPPDYKFPGCSVLSVCASGGLATNTLVFPKAVGDLMVTVPLSAATTELANQHMAAVLAFLAGRLTGEKDLVASVKYRQEPGRPLGLTLRPAGKLGKYMEVRVEVVLAKEGVEFTDEEGDNTETMDRVMAEEVLRGGLRDELERLITSHPAIREALLVLKIWSRQLHLPSCGLLYELLLLHCFLTNIITTKMKTWQIVKKFWTFLSETDLSNQQLILAVPSPMPTASKTRHIQLFDRTGATCLTPACPLQHYSLLRHLGGAALRAQGAGNGVEKCLLTTYTIGALYDRMYRVKGDVDVGEMVKNLSVGLGERAGYMAVVGGGVSWEVQGVEKPVSEVLVGVRLDSNCYQQPATHGPEASLPEAKDFREFWGERSELRRFQDGVVKEVVVWGEAGEGVVKSVVEAVVGRHHAGASVVEEGCWDGGILRGDGGKAARAVYDKLAPMLYGLEGLSLAVAGVSAWSCQARLTRVGVAVDTWKIGGKTVKEKEGVAVLTGRSGMAPRFIQPLEVAVQVEHSGKWPKDAGAVRRLRTAWLKDLGAALSKVPGNLCQLRGESLILVPADSSVVLRLTVEDKDGEVSSLSQLTSWLHGIARHYTAWASAVRLAKRWVSSQLLTDQVPDTAVEITMTHVFQSPGCLGSPPSSPVTAFYRWLNLLTTHDWNEAPLFVGHDSPPDEITSSMSSSRQSLPAMVLSTPHDTSPSCWTKQAPSWPQLQRLIGLASQALETLCSGPSMKVSTAFTPSLSAYDCIIYLKPLQVPTRHLSLDALAEEQTPVSEAERPSLVPVVGYNPVKKYVEELRASYSHLAMFFYDQFGGTVIAVKFKTFSKEEKFKTTELWSRELAETGTGVSINWGAVIEDWSILGEGLVKNVTCQNIDKLLTS